MYRTVFALLLSSAIAFAANAAESGPTVLRPDKACHYMDTVPGMNTASEYENIALGKTPQYFCGTSYKEIGQSFLLANNIAYYADGPALDQVKRVRLQLNVNDLSQKKQALSELRSDARLLFRKTLGRSMPSKIGATIMASDHGSWSIEGYHVSIEKTVWPTGKGYDLNFIIQDPSYTPVYAR